MHIKNKGAVGRANCPFGKTASCIGYYLLPEFSHAHSMPEKQKETTRYTDNLNVNMVQQQ